MDGVMIVRKLRNTNAYVLGKDHAKKGLPCQDRTSFVILDGCYVIALSDGAGSRKLSHLGAEVAVKHASAYFAPKFEEAYQIISHGDQEAVKSLTVEFVSSLFQALGVVVNANPGSDYDDYLCTLEFVVVKGGRYIAGHCGDGVIGILIDEIGEERIDTLSKPENGAAANLTFFINDKNSAPHLRFYCGSMAAVGGFILMSDGPEEALYNKVYGLNRNTIVFFKGCRGVSQEESEDLFKRFLTEKVAMISYDDLSVNVLAFDEASEEDLQNKPWCEDIFGNACKNQVIQESGYSFLYDDSIPQDGWPMSAQELAEFITKEAIR